MSGPSIFVAGGATMLGAALVDRAERRGRTTLNRSLAEPDYRDAAAVDAFMAEARPAHVIVTAGRSGGIAANQRYPADLMIDNLCVAVNVITAAWRHGASKLLYLASSCTYPRDTPQPMRPGALGSGPLEPTSAAYATAKLAGMQLCAALARQHGVHFRAAIPADAFGPRDDFSRDDSHVVAGLIRRLHDAKLAGSPVADVWGSGAARRDFVYVDDLADACLVALDRHDSLEPINLGTGVDRSIRELAETVRDVVGYPGALRYDTRRPDGMPYKALDATAIRALGWQPSVELHEAIARTYAWFVACRGAAAAHAPDG